MRLSDEIVGLANGDTLSKAANGRRKQVYEVRLKDLISRKESRAAYDIRQHTSIPIAGMTHSFMGGGNIETLRRKEKNECE